jgi:arginyl-tRNA synthetase
MGKYPDIVKVCAETLEPHHLTAYLRELAGTFHTLFTAGVKDDAKRFLLPQNPDLTQSRLSLITGLKLVLSNALSLIGIAPLERM